MNNYTCFICTCTVNFLNISVHPHVYPIPHHTARCPLTPALTPLPPPHPVESGVGASEVTVTVTAVCWYFCQTAAHRNPLRAAADYRTKPLRQFSGFNTCHMSLYICKRAAATAGACVYSTVPLTDVGRRRLGGGARD